MTSEMPLVFDFIVDNIYLGNIVAARTESIINFVDVIINISNSRYNEDTNKKYYHIDIHDRKNINLEEHFKIFDEIIKNNKDKIILIHCKCGVSRSVSFVIYYLMKYRNLTMNQSFQYLKHKRSHLSTPNIGFLFQLLNLDKVLFGKKSCKIGDRLIYGTCEKCNII